MDYGNRDGFSRMLDVLNKHKMRACCCLNLEILDHFPEIKDAMIAADWDYVARSLQQPADLRPDRRAGTRLLAGLHHPSKGDALLNPSYRSRLGGPRWHRTCRVAPISRSSGWFEAGRAWRKRDD
jgi:hypothetical protein